MKIYLVVGTYTDYDTNSHWNVEAHLDRADAEIAAALFNDASLRIKQGQDRLKQLTAQWIKDNPCPPAPLPLRLPRRDRKTGEYVKACDRWRQEYSKWSGQQAEFVAKSEAELLSEEDRAWKKTDGYYWDGFYEVEEVEVK